MSKLKLLSLFDIVFQFKIVTQILPTNEYLLRYRVKDTSTCENCDIECDTIVHRLYNCETIVPILSSIFQFIEQKCRYSDSISMIEYLFGKSGEKHLALNQILLELKKSLFYNINDSSTSEPFCEQFWKTCRSLIIKEKLIASQNNKLEKFSSKWENYTAIYDFRGPDIQPL